MAIIRRQMRPSNRHIASMVACYGPKRQTTAQLAQKGRPQQESKSTKVKSGVIQGGVLSPALITTITINTNYYPADFPTPPPNIS